MIDQDLYTHLKMDQPEDFLRKVQWFQNDWNRHRKALEGRKPTF